MGMQVRCIFVWREKQILSDLRDKDVLFKRNRKIEKSKLYICINYDQIKRARNQTRCFVRRRQESERTRERKRERLIRTQPRREWFAESLYYTDVIQFNR